MKDDRKKPDIGYGLLLALFAVVVMFNICIFSYIGCEMVPWLMAGGFDAVAEQPAAPTPVQQIPAQATPAPTPPPADGGQPIEELTAPTEPTQGEAPAEPPVEGEPAPAPTQAAVAESAAPVDTPAPAATKTPTAATSPTEPLVPIAPSVSTPTLPNSTAPGSTASSGTSGNPNPNGATSGAFVGSTEKNIYHYPHCRYYDDILPEHLIWFDTVEEAQADNRRACKVCSPP